MAIPASPQQQPGKIPSAPSVIQSAFDWPVADHTQSGRRTASTSTKMQRPTPAMSRTQLTPVYAGLSYR
jgi:hypothetical protein